MSEEPRRDLVDLHAVSPPASHPYRLMFGALIRAAGKVTERRSAEDYAHCATRALRAITSIYPFNTPRASILRRLPSIPKNFGEFGGKRGVRYRGYWTSSDEVCRSLFWFGDFDPWVDTTIRRLAIPGSDAVDIGANIGATALVMGRAVGPAGQVFCFEPMQPNVDYLRQNIAANGMTWVRIEPVALLRAFCNV